MTEECITPLRRRTIGSLLILQRTIAIIILRHVRINQKRQSILRGTLAL